VDASTNGAQDGSLISIQSAQLERSYYSRSISRYYYHLYEFSAKLSLSDFLANMWRDISPA